MGRLDHLGPEVRSLGEAPRSLEAACHGPVEAAHSRAEAARSRAEAARNRAEVGRSREGEGRSREVEAHSLQEEGHSLVVAARSPAAVARSLQVSEVRDCMVEALHDLDLWEEGRSPQVVSDGRDLAVRLVVHGLPAEGHGLVAHGLVAGGHSHVAVQIHSLPEAQLHSHQAAADSSEEAVRSQQAVARSLAEAVRSQQVGTKKELGRRLSQEALVAALRGAVQLHSRVEAGSDLAALVAPRRGKPR